jgi:release factor glutamine methyltransferase
MNTREASIKLIKSLLEIYSPAEAASIGKIVMEDVFSVGDLFEEQPFPQENLAKLDAILQRLMTHEPVQYVLGQTDFYGMKLRVTPAVLIPRQETEETVAWVLETVPQLMGDRSPLETANRPFRMLDIGTGSGCIPIALKKKLPAVEMHCLDVSAAALEVARENAAAQGTEVFFHEMDIFDKAAWESLPGFDVIVSNPPYVTEEERTLLPKNVIDYEPHLALFAGGNDAQRFVKVIAGFALQKLNPGGKLFLETNEFYAPATKRILKRKGFVNVELRADLNGKLRMIKAEKI